MHDDDDDGIIWHCLNTVVEEGSGKKRINFTFASSHSTTRSLAFVALASVVAAAAAASYSHFDLVVEWARVALAVYDLAVSRAYYADRAGRRQFRQLDSDYPHPHCHSVIHPHHPSGACEQSPYSPDLLTVTALACV